MGDDAYNSVFCQSNSNVLVSLVKNIVDIQDKSIKIHGTILFTANGRKKFSSQRNALGDHFSHLQLLANTFPHSISCRTVSGFLSSYYIMFTLC